VFGRRCAQIELEPRSDAPLVHKATALAFRGLRTIWSHTETPARWRRTPELVRDGNDDFALLIAVSGAMTRSQCGNEIRVGKGAAVAILQTEPASLEFDRLSHIGVMVPRASLSPFVRDLEDAAMRPIPEGNEAVRLLRTYLAPLRGTTTIANASLRPLVAAHVCDLVSLAIGATREGQEVAMSRGLRAARLRAIKEDLDSNPLLTLHALATRQGVTTRYVQRLFELEGTSLTEYTLGLRLHAAHRMLTHPSYASWTIGSIAFEAGFGDLSHFYRSFKRRYGASPSDIRAGRMPPNIQDAKDRMRESLDGTAE
jgi:AraC-like DNA-binding protein